MYGDFQGFAAYLETARPVPGWKVPSRDV